MDEATRARAFEPYFTTKPVGGGSGLGLAVVHGIASALGGSVAVESALGRGTTVEVWLPRVGDATATALPPPAPRVRGSGRILLVDDDPPVARALGRILERLGYEVTACGDGAEALARFRAEPTRFDAVLTDETLPGMRGHQLTRELLALRPDLPVLICTGYSEHLDEERAREIGARGLFMKPFDVAQLGEALRAALAQ
jgi:CheY-like chemotaxis protein